MTLYNNITRYIFFILFLMAATIAKADGRDGVDNTTVCDSDTIMLPKTLQEKIDSILGYNYSHTVYKTVTKRGRHRRYRTVTEKAKASIPLTAGCCVYNLSADSVVYGYNEEKMMTPASTQKMFVATAMLEKFGSKFSFDTKVMTDAVIRKDSVGRKYLDGDIFIHGGCDPLFDSSYPDSICHAISRLGVDSINGRIISYRTARYNHIQLKEEKIASIVAKGLLADSIHFTSEQPWGTTTFYEDLNCRQMIIKLSTPLDKVLTRMMKRSNNNCAEAVLLSLVPDDDQWDYDDCCDVVRKTLSKVLANVGDRHVLDEVYDIHDGSGLSHSNKTTAKTQVALLRYIYNKYDLYNALRNYLPIAGIDGTLSKRMKDSNAYSRVRAKTGTVNKVQTLCGFASAMDGDIIAFSILIGNCSDQSLGRRIQDNICELLVDME